MPLSRGVLAGVSEVSGQGGENTAQCPIPAMTFEDERTHGKSDSQRIDQILTDLKDERFHVRTTEKPHGLFDADIGPASAQLFLDFLYTPTGQEVLCRAGLEATMPTSSSPLMTRRAPM